EYDDVANDQRRVVYEQRNDILHAEDLSENIKAIRVDVVNDFISGYIPPQSMVEQWDVDGLEHAIETDFRIKMPIQQWLDDDKSLHEETLREKIIGVLEEAYATKEANLGDEAHVMRQLEKHVMLATLDRLWKEHLANMDHLRQGIHLRGYAQKNPKQEYKREAFELFQTFLENVKLEVVRVLTTVELRRQEEVEELERQRRAAAERELTLQHADASATAENEQPDQQGNTPFQRQERKVGRNEPCPCGSGKKYKHCHGQVE
ncbi:MAG TPA: preprotein translocase subunit SecA, partial [Gammaproteobacteria bacterium]|nr:preprotein translocase subunit SecA [Gammaproteobacteria bacterium]